MSEGHAHPHAPVAPAFRFEAYADAPAAQAAFEAAFPLGSPIEPALQALVDMGAHCRAVGPARFVCRHVETEKALAGYCWHLSLECDDYKTLRSARISLAIAGL